MKSQTRGLITFLLVFFLWGTIITGPFRYFAYAFRDFFLWIFSRLNSPDIVTFFIVPILLISVMIVFLVLGTKKYAAYTAGICALLSLLYYLFHCILQSSFDSVSFAVVIGLALALAFIIFRVDTGSLWLSDAYIYSLYALLFFELVATPILLNFSDLRETVSGLWPILPSTIAPLAGDLLGLPNLLWDISLFILLSIPVFFLSRGRKKG